MTARKLLGVIGACALLTACAYADLPGNISYVNATEALDKREYDKAFRTLSALVNRGGFHGQASAEVLLSELYVEGRGTPQNVPMGIQLLERAAASKDELQWAAIAQSRLGSLYEAGKPPHVSPDPVKAAQWYEKSVRLGDNVAQSALDRLNRDPEVYVKNHIGDFGRSGRTRPGDLTEIPQVIKTAPTRAFEIADWHAREGNVRARFEMAKLYYNGVGAPKDRLRALRWLYLAADGGDSDAQLSLAQEYSKGDDLPLDLSKSRKWMEASAEKGNAIALNELGVRALHPIERGGRSDPQRAFMLFSRAADLGEDNAHANLSDMYEDGIGVQADPQKARFHLEKAASLGNAAAKKKLSTTAQRKEQPIVTERVIREKIIVEEKQPVRASAEDIFRLNNPSVFQVVVGAVTRVGSKTEVDKSGTGSAVAVTEKNALTNCHVVTGMNVIMMKFGEDFHAARVIHRDEERDVCVIQSVEKKLIPIKAVREYDDLRIGEVVYTIGSPAGYENSLAQGVLSGKRRISSIDWVQTTAAISPGSSGGGLFDGEGRLIGITTFKSGREGAEGLNFAAPAKRFYDVARRL